MESPNSFVEHSKWLKLAMDKWEEQNWKGKKSRRIMNCFFAKEIAKNLRLAGEEIDKQKEANTND